MPDDIRDIDRRAFARRRVNAAIQLRRAGSGAPPLNGRLVDLSPGGAGIVLDSALAVGEAVDLHYHNAIQRVQFRADGRVQATVGLSNGGNRVGMSFPERRLDPKTIQLLTWNVR